MADKKYYWLKLKRDFFKRHDIRIIEEMPNGKDYILFYLKLLLESIDHEGELRFSDTIPYNEQMLSVITNTNIDIVRAAMKMFVELQMVDIFDDKTIFMNEVQRMIGSETKGAERVRKHRENKKALHCNTIPEKCNTEIEKEKDTEKDIETENNNGDSPEPPSAPPRPKKEKPVFKRYGENGWVQLTDEQYNRLIADLGEVETMRCIEYIDESAQLTGNKNKWKDWNLVIRRCSRDGWGLKQKQGRKEKKPSWMQPSCQPGQAEIEAVRRSMNLPYPKPETSPEFEAQAEEARRKIQELGSL